MNLFWIGWKNEKLEINDWTILHQNLMNLPLDATQSAYVHCTWIYVYLKRTLRMYIVHGFMCILNVQYISWDKPSSRDRGGVILFMISDLMLWTEKCCNFQGFHKCCMYVCISYCSWSWPNLVSVLCTLNVSCT